MSRADSYMPMWWGDYLRDTSHLDNGMHGAYLMLIQHYWCASEPLVDDDGVLWRVARCNSIKDWKRIRPIIVRFFRVVDGVWHHKRVDEEIEKAKAKFEKRSQAGRKGNETRWPGDRNATKTPSQCDPNAVPMRSHSSGHVSSLRSDTARGRLPAELEGEFDAWWDAYPEKKGKPDARKAFATARKKIGFDELMAATLGYVERIRKPGAPHPKYPQGWLNGERWLDEQQAPSATTTVGYDPDADWRGRLDGWRKQGFWRSQWGPPPGEPDCEVPRHLLDDAAA